MGILEDIRLNTEKGRRKDVERLVLQALEENVDREEIISRGLIPSMEVVSSQYSNSEADILKILTIARCIQDSLHILHPDLDLERNPNAVGTAIVGTVEGDLHDIGKNILVLMFRCNGINVIDLGVNVPDKKFVKTMKEHPEARIICVSSLLTTLLPDLKKSIAAIRRADKKKRFAIMLGGSGVSEQFADNVGADYYTTNAVDCARLAREHLLALNQKEGNA